MFTTIKAKLTLYKWGFIIFAIFGLILFSGVQFYQISLMKLEAKHSSEKIEKQEETINNLTNKISKQNESIENAIKRLSSLREEISSITKDTKRLHDKVNNIPKPVEGGANSEEIEIEINKISDEILERIRNAGKEVK